MPSAFQRFIWRITSDRKILLWSGALLFHVGMIGALIATFAPKDSDKSLWGQSAFLIALGCPLVYYVQALARIAVLEQRIAALEKPAEPPTDPGRQTNDRDAPGR